MYWDIQSSLSKTFAITERITSEFKVSAYNLTNRLNRDNPEVNVTNSNFGQALRQSNTTPAGSWSMV
jgi:hypothetical protein